VENKDKVAVNKDEIIRIVKDCVGNIESELDSKLQLQTDDYDQEINTVKEGLENDLWEVQEQLENQENELMDVKTAMKSLEDKLKDITKELKSVKDEASNVASNLEIDVMCELSNVKEELKVVKKTMRAANVEREDVASNLKKDVNCELRNEKEELRVAVKEKLRGANIIGQNKTVDHIQEAQMIGSYPFTTTQINNKKRNRDSRYQTFIEQNKRMQKQSNCGDERDIAFVSNTSVYSSSTSSSDSA